MSFTPVCKHQHILLCVYKLLVIEPRFVGRILSRFAARSTGIRIFCLTKRGASGEIDPARNIDDLIVEYELENSKR